MGPPIDESITGAFSMSEFNVIIFDMKNLQKGFVIPLAITIVALLLIGSGVYFYTNKKVAEAPVIKPEIVLPTSTSTPIIGGDTDAHGCLGPAGYSWCAVKNKCLRVWEEKCEVIATSTSTRPPCKTDMDCRELSCPAQGGFAHEKCISGSCILPADVKERCLSTTEPSDPVACTMDAKQCPDGSYVGRSGQNCEFVCPTVR